MKRLVFALKKSMRVLIAVTLFALIGLFKTQSVDAAVTYNGTSYSTISAAIQAVGTSTSTKTITFTSNMTECVTVNTTTPLDFALAGYTWGCSNVDEYTLTVEAPSFVTLTNGVIQPSSATYGILNNGRLVLSNMKVYVTTNFAIRNNPTGVLDISSSYINYDSSTKLEYGSTGLQNMGMATVKNSYIYSNLGSAVINGGGSSADTNVLNVTGGVIDGMLIGLDNSLPAVATINTSLIRADQRAIHNSSRLQLKNGGVTVTGDSGSTYSTIYSTGDLTINGTSVNGGPTTGNYAIEGAFYYYGGTLTSSSGSGVAKPYNVDPTIPAGASIVTSQLSTTGGYSVTLDTSNVVVASLSRNGGTYVNYTSLTAAINAAVSSSSTTNSIMLRYNVVSECITLTTTSTNFTIDLNGFSWYCEPGFNSLSTEESNLRLNAGNNNITIIDSVGTGYLYGGVPTLYITGGTVTISTTIKEVLDGYNIYLSGGELNIEKDASIVHNGTTSSIYVYGSGVVVNANGGEIIGYVYNGGGTFNLNGSTIVGAANNYPIQNGGTTNIYSGHLYTKSSEVSGGTVNIIGKISGNTTAVYDGVSYAKISYAYGTASITYGGTTTYYSSLQAAVDALDHDTLKTILILNSVSEDITISTDKYGVIDLNGYTWTGTLTVLEDDVVETAPEITITDSSSTKSGKMFNESNEKMISLEEGRFHLDGVKIIHTYTSGTLLYIGQNVYEVQIINSSTLLSSNTTIYTNANITISNSTVQSDYATALQVSAYGSAGMRNSTITGAAGVVNYGILMIEDSSTITGVSGKGLYSESDDAVVYIGAMDDQGTYISGGSITGYDVSLYNSEGSTIYFLIGSVFGATTEDGDGISICNNGNLYLETGANVYDGGSVIHTIYNDGSGTIEMNGGNVFAESGGSMLLYNDGSFTMTGGYLGSTGDCSIAIENYYDITITGGIVYGIYNVIVGGTVTIGSQDSSYSQSSPSITSGSGYAIYDPDEFNFYNGIIKGGTNPYNVAPSGQRSDGTLTLGVVDDFNAAYYVVSAAINVASITYGGTTTYYETLQAAIDALDSSVSKTIEVLDDISECVDVIGKVGVINLNSLNWECDGSTYAISVDESSNIIINGEDATLQAYYWGIENCGELTMNYLEYTLYESEGYDEVALSNSGGVVNLNYVAISDAAGYSAILTSGGTVNITGGTISSSEVYISGNAEVEVDGTEFIDALINNTAGSALTIVGIDMSGQCNGLYAITNAGNLYLNGGEIFVSGTSGIKNTGTMEITGTIDITGQGAGIGVYGGTVTIDIVGTIRGDNDEGIAIENASVTLINGNVISGSNLYSGVRVENDGVFTITENSTATITSNSYAVDGQATFNFYGGILYTTDTSLEAANYTIPTLLDGYVVVTETIDNKLKTYVTLDQSAFVASVKCGSTITKYTSIESAINGNSCSGKTVTLLQHISDVSVTFTQYNMIIDLAGFDWNGGWSAPIIISSSSANITITDSIGTGDSRSKLEGFDAAIVFTGGTNGKLNVNNVRLVSAEGSNVTFAALHINSGIVNVTNSHIDGLRQHGIYVASGTVTLTNTYVEQSEGGARSIIEIASGTVTIVSGTIFSKLNNYGVYVNGGTLNIGNNNTSDNEAIKIYGQEYAVYNAGGTINFNKGTLYGSIDNVVAYYGGINVTSIVNSTSDEDNGYRVSAVGGTAKVSATTYFDENDDGTNETITIKYPTITDAVYLLANTFSYSGVPRIKLLSNIDNECVNILTGRGYIDLNNHTWNCNSTNTATIQVYNVQFLRITNGTISGKYRGIYGSSNNFSLTNVDISGPFTNSAFYLTGSSTVVKYYSGDITVTGTATGSPVDVNNGATFHYYNGTITGSSSSNYSSIYVSDESKVYLIPAVTIPLDFDNDILEDTGEIRVYSYSNHPAVESLGLVEIGYSLNDNSAGPNHVYTNDVELYSQNDYAVVNSSGGTFRFYGGTLYGKTSNVNAYSGTYRTDEGLAFSNTVVTVDSGTYNRGILVDAVWKVADSSLTTNESWNYYAYLTYAGAGTPAIEDSRLNNGTITLLRDSLVAVNITQEITFTVNLHNYTLGGYMQSSPVTINNGNANISFASNGGEIKSTNSSYYALNVLNGQVSLEQTSIVGAGTAVYNGGTIILNDLATITTTSTSTDNYSVINDGVLTINNTYSAAYTIDKTILNNSQIVINNGNLELGTNGPAITNKGGVTIYNGTISSQSTSVIVNEGTLDIRNGKINNTGNGYGILNSGTLTISGGNIISAGSNAISSSTGSVRITAGYVYSSATVNTATISIGGGTLTIGSSPTQTNLYVISKNNYAIKTNNIGFTYNGGYLYGTTTISNKLMYSLGTGGVSTYSGYSISTSQQSLTLSSVFSGTLTLIKNWLIIPNVSVNDT